MSYITYAQLVDASNRAIGTHQNPLVFQIARAAIQSILSISFNVDGSIGDHIVIPAVPGQRIKVLSLSVFSPSGPGAVMATFTDGIGGDALFQFPAQAPADSVFTFETAANPPAFLFATSPGNPLNLNLNATNQVLANITYWMDS
jgi:hypothetical protein